MYICFLFFEFLDVSYTCLSFLVGFSIVDIITRLSVQKGPTVRATRFNHRLEFRPKVNVCLDAALECGNLQEFMRSHSDTIGNQY